MMGRNESERYEQEQIISKLERELKESNAVCMCGCAEHESYGEDGESCGVDSHDCIRVSKSAAALYDRLERELDKAIDAIQKIGHTSDELQQENARLLRAVEIADTRSSIAIRQREHAWRVLHSVERETHVTVDTPCRGRDCNYGHTEALAAERKGEMGHPWPCTFNQTTCCTCSSPVPAAERTTETEG